MTQETNADEIESIFQATYTTFPKCSACDRMRFHRYRIHSGRNICSLSVSELIKWMSSAELCSACIRVLVAAKRFITLLISRFIFAAVVFPAIWNSNSVQPYRIPFAVYLYFNMHYVCISNRQKNLRGFSHLYIFGGRNHWGVGNTARDWERGGRKIQWKYTAKHFIMWTWVQCKVNLYGTWLRLHCMQFNNLNATNSHKEQWNGKGHVSECMYEFFLCVCASCRRHRHTFCVFQNR